MTTIATTTTLTVPEKLKQMADQLPRDCTWEDAMYQIYVRIQIEAGEADIRAGRTVSTAEIRKRFGLSK